MSTNNIKCTIFNIKMKITLNYPKSAAMGFFFGTQERVPKSSGKRAISVLSHCSSTVYAYLDSGYFHRRKRCISSWSDHKLKPIPRGKIQQNIEENVTYTSVFLFLHFRSMSFP